MAQELSTVPLQIHHGHTNTHVYVQFTRLTSDIAFTEEQALAFIRAMQESIDKLAAHKLKLAGSS